MASLEDVLNDTGEEQVEQETEQPEQAQEEQQEPVETPEQKEEPQKVETPSTDETEAYKKAMLEERRKRQEYERLLREREQQKEEEKPKKEFWDDPEGLIKEQLESVKRELTTETTTRFLRLSENLARKRYEDYDAKIEAFNEALQTNPYLYQQMIEAEDPAEFAYRAGELHEFSRGASSFSDLKEKIRQQVLQEEREKLEREIAEKYKSERISSVPQSLSEEQATTARNQKPQGDRESLDSILSD